MNSPFFISYEVQIQVDPFVAAALLCAYRLNWLQRPRSGDCIYRGDTLARWLVQRMATLELKAPFHSWWGPVVVSYTFIHLLWAKAWEPLEGMAIGDLHSPSLTALMVSGLTSKHTGRTQIELNHPPPYFSSHQAIAPYHEDRSRRTSDPLLLDQSQKRGGNLGVSEGD